MKKALTIAGSDSSGGAGIQADLKTFQELGVYGMSSLTVIVAMDPHNDWSHQVFPIAADTIEAQIETALVGIGADALKTGMLPTSEIIELAARAIKNSGIKKVVVDPVMVCKGAGEPLNPESADCYKKNLLPLAAVVTPNVFEASQLSGIKIQTAEDMKQAAKIIKDLGAGYVVVKGGKIGNTALDVVYDGKSVEILESQRIDTSYTHGAGCTFAAAITAELAKGADAASAVKTAKAFVTRAIDRSFALNRFVGTLDRSSAYRGE
ncbi:MAG: pyridoxine/pyridoxal/pyridoxamine kinase [Oscillospiraceae bacterium]|nr:pyridoxine/pyridoxal/pyridoxamine kinase [Oscillospiraceae bacterium]